MRRSPSRYVSRAYGYGYSAEYCIRYRNRYRNHQVAHHFCAPDHALHDYETKEAEPTSDQLKHALGPDAPAQVYGTRQEVL